MMADVTSDINNNVDALDVAHRWCKSKGLDWSVRSLLGEGGTAPVYEIASPEGFRALKVYDLEFSAGAKGEIEKRRIDEQIALRGHNCPSLVQVYEGGNFEGRLWILMSRAPGKELEKCLHEVPRNKIRHIVDQVARAALFLEAKGRCHRDIKSANIFVSEDFEHVTLLDVSVIRNISDPVGVGTDRDGKLPVLATARYTPPEYLFRLLEPGPKLWHALNVYQMGALLHDLIMGEPLFQTEYLSSADNRYRFAWVVATVIPKVTSGKVDQDLVFTARRALDKDWKRRSSLRLEDFLADASVRLTHALDLIGFSSDRMAPPLNEDPAKLAHLRDVSRQLEAAILKYLSENGVTAKHKVSPGSNDYLKVLLFTWESPKGSNEAASRAVEFQLDLELLLTPEVDRFATAAKLSVTLGPEVRRARIDLPDLQDNLELGPALAEQAQSALKQLALEINRAESG